MKITSVLGLTILLCISCANEKSYQGFGKDSIDTATINKFAPKPLDDAFADEIEKFTTSVMPGGGRLSPDGKSLYFSWSITGISQVFRMDGPQRFPIQLTSGNQDTGIESLSPDGTFLVISRDSSGEENPGLYLLDTTTGGIETLYRKKGVQCFLQKVSLDSRRIYYSANDKENASRTLYVYDVKSKEHKLFFDQKGLWSIADTLDENLFILEKNTGSTSSEFYLYTVATQKLEPLLGQGESEEYSVTFSKNPELFFVSTNRFDDFTRLYQWDKKTWTPVTEKIDQELEGFIIDSIQRSKLFLMFSDKGYSRVRVLDAATFKDLPLPKLPEDVDQLGIGFVSRDGRYNLFGTASYNEIKKYMYDWQTGELTEWMIAAHPEIDTSKFVKTVLEYYPAHDGTQIPMFVTRPQNCEEPCPVIVDFHGGPEGQSTPGYSQWTQLIVKHGFVLARPNVRGSYGYGKAWLDADNGAKRLEVITDIEDCAIHIRKNWAVGGKEPKVGVMGGSYGGYAALYAMTRFAGAYDAGVATVGMSNLVTFLNNTAPYRRALRISEYGDPEKDFSALTELSPTTHLDKIKAPLMIIQGANDPRVPVGEAVQFYEALAKKKIPAELIIFGDEGHGASKRSNVVLELGHTIRFFEENLKH